MRWYALVVFCMSLVMPALADDAVSLRRQYNQVAASIDTLFRLYGGEALGELARPSGDGPSLPVDSKLVLYFWADDEAELYLNGHRIGDTRLTPTRIEIPTFYLRQSNVLRAHCWDTDQVESGFMAGLYVQDAGARLREVLVTDEVHWWVGGERAEVRFYNHTIPDIPGAEVIWGQGLFGEVVLEAAFDAEQLSQAAYKRPLSTKLPSAVREPMETHLVVSRLAQLERERGELTRQLEARRSPVQDVRYQGAVNGRLAFTLGKAGALAELKSINTAEKLLNWARVLPTRERELVFRERRDLKGVRHATPARSLASGAGGESDRRIDYIPPAERGRIYGQGLDSAQGGSNSSFRMVATHYRMRWDLWGVSVGLMLYLGVAGREWWKLFKAKVWIS